MLPVCISAAVRRNTYSGEAGGAADMKVRFFERPYVLVILQLRKCCLYTLQHEAPGKGTVQDTST